MKLPRLTQDQVAVKKRLAAEALKNLREYGNCDLFRTGLVEIGLVGGKEYWWDCELFQVGLQELGLV
jgi:hypothetical protein